MAKKKEEEFDFELDADDKIDEYASEVNLILTVLGKIDQDLVHSVLTNSSKFEDFDLTDEELDDVITDLGFAIKNENYIVDIAKKMRDNA
ncbi:MAG: hypothetical protein CBC02_003745 [Flavobacteriaceae bacterium TMED42]|nr:MAG: hypothetical protein CBC02_003745 [Flavobacteriaceae bacterium TMED42]|tara:strand:- start:895 stop:1164 length:270 start_codon:yes stop_codon:yes gene_type:complete